MTDAQGPGVVGETGNWVSQDGFVSPDPGSVLGGAPKHGTPGVRGPCTDDEIQHRVSTAGGDGWWENRTGVPVEDQRGGDTYGLSGRNRRRLI